MDASSYTPVPFASLPLRVDVGEPMPAGTDAVLPLDAVTMRANRAEAIATVSPGEGVLPAGGDVAPETILRRTGSYLRASDIAVMAAAGIADVMVRDRLPILPLGATMREAVVQLAERRGIVMVLDDQQRLAGVITAGDLTRLMEREREFLAFPVREVMTRGPKTAVAGELGSGAVYRMERHGIMAMPVVNDSGGVDGLVHLHDLLRAGVA